MTNDKGIDELSELINSVVYGIGGILRVAVLGLWQLRRPMFLFAVTVSMIAGAIAGVFFFSYRWWLFWCPPLILVMMYGFVRQSEIDFYRKAFLDVGFKGRDGKAPYLISKRDLGNHRTGLFFRSNISLQQWKKSIPDLQTAMDCTVLSVKKGKSQKIVHMVSIPADMELSSFMEWKDEYMSAKASVMVLGESIAGRMSFDLNSTPHSIYAGTTGSGKSVLLRLVVYQCIAKGHKVYLMDFKQGVEFGKAYDDFCEVIMDKGRAVELLTSLVEENKRRLDEFRRRGIKNLDEYNAINRDDPLERIVVFIDELAILLIPTNDAADRKFTYLATDCLENIAILGRAAGIHLQLGIQRPDANTVTGQIKSNVSGRVCGYFADSAPSMIVLNNTRANDIDSEAKGRFMFQDGRETIEMQGYYQKEEQVIEGIINSRTARFAPEGIIPDLPTKRTVRKPVRTKAAELDFSYGEEDV